MNGLAHILHGGESQNLDLASLRVDLDVDDMHGEGVTGTAGIDRPFTGDRSTGAALAGGDFFETEALRRVGSADIAAAMVFYIALFDFKLAGGALAHFDFDVFSGIVAGVAGGVGDPAAAGAAGIADRTSVGDRRVDIIRREPESFGDDHCHRGATAADIDRAFVEVDGAIVVDRNRG